MNRMLVIALSLDGRWLLPFLLLSFLFIVIVTAVIYKIMWLRLEKIIQEKKEEEKSEEKREEESEKIAETKAEDKQPDILEDEKSH